MKLYDQESYGILEKIDLKILLALAKSDDSQEVFSDESLYGLKPIENSFYEDSPNRRS